jgi:hypothetical protein
MTFVASNTYYVKATHYRDALIAEAEQKAARA